jgi:hypothetical protein
LCRTGWLVRVDGARGGRGGRGGRGVRVGKECGALNAGKLSDLRVGAGKAVKVATGLWRMQV